MFFFLFKNIYKDHTKYILAENWMEIIAAFLKQFEVKALKNHFGNSLYNLLAMTAWLIKEMLYDGKTRSSKKKEGGKNVRPSHRYTFTFKADEVCPLGPVSMHEAYIDTWQTNKRFFVTLLKAGDAEKLHKKTPFALHVSGCWPPYTHLSLGHSCVIVVGQLTTW